MPDSQIWMSNVLKKLHFISEALKCPQSVRIVSVQRSSEYRRTLPKVSGKSSQIIGSGSDVFQNPGHDETKISAFDSEKLAGISFIDRFQVATK